MKSKVIKKYPNLKPFITGFVNQPINWGKETRLMKSLYDRFPNGKFWEAMIGWRKVPTLLHFFSPQNQYEIGLRFEKFLKDSLVFEKPTIFNLTEKVGEDKVFKPGKKTLMEFVNESV